MFPPKKTFEGIQHFQKHPFNTILKSSVAIRVFWDIEPSFVSQVSQLSVEPPNGWRLALKKFGKGNGNLRNEYQISKQCQTKFSLQVPSLQVPLFQGLHMLTPLNKSHGTFTIKHLLEAHLPSHNLYYIRVHLALLLSNMAHLVQWFSQRTLKISIFRGSSGISKKGPPCLMTPGMVTLMVGYPLVN